MPTNQTDLLLQRNRVFLSYAKEDIRRVGSIHKKLVAAGLNPWVDYIDLPHGSDWDRSIAAALRNSRFVIVFLSNRSITKRGYVQKEIREALDLADSIPDGQLFILPVRLEVCTVPERLCKWHWVDVFKPKAFAKMVSSIKSELGITETKRIKTKESPFLSEQDNLDHRFASFFPLGNWYIEVRLSSGMLVYSNGHIMDMRERRSKIIQKSRKFYPHPPEFGETNVKRAMPSASKYRKAENLVEEIIPKRSMYILVSRKGERCAVARLYMNYFLSRYPDGKTYISGRQSPVVVEVDRKPNGLFMPLKVPDKRLY